MASRDTDAVMADSHSEDWRIGVTWLELDQRDADGLITTLEWCPHTNEVWVHCEHEGVTRPLLVCRVAATDARRALRYPFAYAYSKLMSVQSATDADERWRGKSSRQ